MKPIKIVSVIDRMVIGGPTKQIIWLASGMNPKQFECVLITGMPADGEVDMTPLARQSGVNLIVLPNLSREIRLRDLVVTWQLLRHFFRLKPDIVHTHKSKAGATGRFAALLYRWLTPSALLLRPRPVRVMHTFHGHILHGYYGQLKAALFATIERVLARCTGRIVVLCEQQQNEICSEFGIGKAQQFRVVPLGFEFDLAPPSAWSGLLRSEYRIAVDELLIGAFGRMCEVKNFGMLIRAFARLRRSAPDLRVRLVLVGDGQLRTELEQIAHEVCVSADVIFTGYRTDAMSLYDDIDIVALSSVNEGTPVTLLEGMSRGCPVVSTEVGGVASMMGIRQRDGDAFTTWEHGLTVPSGDEESLAAALEFLALRPQLRSQMGDAAQHSVLRKFSRERFIRGMEELYLELSNPVQADTCEIVANTAEVYTSSQ